MKIASIVFAFAFVVGCGGKPKPAAAPENTGGDPPPPAETKVCHDMDNCGGHGTCLALCAGGPPADDAACSAKCDAECPVIACPPAP